MTGPRFRPDRTLAVGAVVVIGCAVCWAVLAFIFFHRFEYVNRPNPHATAPAVAAPKPDSRAQPNR